MKKVTMMNLKHKRTFKKPLLITVAIIILIGITFCLYVYVFKGPIPDWKKSPVTQVNTVNYDKPSKEQSEAGDNIENDNKSNNPSQVGSDRAPQPSGTSQDKGKTPVTITSSGQNGNTAQIRSLISAVVNTGTCTLTMTKQAQTVIKTSPIQSLPSSTTCQGFDIPISELSPGTWKVELVFENDTLKGVASSNINIQQVVQ